MCTGRDQISVFIAPENCSTKFHEHHTNFNGKEINVDENQCTNCLTHIHDCGCSSPQTSFYKLTNPLIFISNIQFESKLFAWLVDIFNGHGSLSLHAEKEPDWVDCSTAPPIAIASLKFLIRIQQLKIPGTPEI
ncbi:MAG: hypothetical protein CSA36_08145 [Draconibacterium sp.]|nr:MAG: hypothetical protein CSA36_08145 [Draconibacterium sp.]